MKDELVFWQKG